MKKTLALLLSMLLLFPCLAAADGIVLNKTKGAHADFSFPEDAQLLEVYFPKIYGCDSSLVRFGEYTMLIDCAGNQYKEVQALLGKLGISELTYAVNSHPDADHIGGFNHVLKKIPAGEFLLGFPEDHGSGDEVRFKVYADLHAMNIPLRRVSDGECIAFGDVQITVHQRTDEHLPRVNNKSVMLMIRYGERSIFFTGDIQSHTQKLLGEQAGILDLKADILKFPHHGYEPMQEEFLSMVSPEFVIATGGQANANGLKQLREHEIPFLQTSSSMLKLTTDGTVWTIERF